MKKKFLYLVHGDHKLIRNYDFLADRADADLIQSTYNEPAEGAHYFPGSTWAEGRNGLLKKALDREETYEYYIFMDDDVEFHKGGFDELEKQLKQLKPAVAVPVFVPKTTRTVLALGLSYHRKFFFPFTSHQVCTFADGQFMAFHRDVIEDRVLLPLQNKFDEVSWWYTSSTQQLLMHTLYPDTTLQLNTVAVTNESHREYTKNSYKAQQNEWLKNQLAIPIYNPRPWASNLLTVEGVRYTVRNFKWKEYPKVIRVFLKSLIGTLKYKPRDDHHIRKRELKRIFKEGSDLYEQVLNGK